LPPGLDPLLVDKLPARPGLYFFHGENDETLRLGSASNLKLQVQNYFRLDRMSVKAATTAGRIRNITWQVTRGPFGAQLRATAIAGTARTPQAKFTEAAAYSWQFVPEAHPCVRLVDLGSASRNTADTFGIFASARKAQNQLFKMALQQPLCHRLLGIQVHAQSNCLACAQEAAGVACVDRPLRLRHLTRCCVALTKWPRLQWPYPGAIGVRERGELHVCHAWRYLGSGSTEPEIYALLQARRPPLDARMFALLSRRLPRVSRKNLIDLSRYGVRDSGYERDVALAQPCAGESPYFKTGGVSNV
jgi:DNA polymerase-3 subunit epsilon